MAALVLLALAVRLYRLDAQDIWWDEARNIDVVARPLAEITTAGELDIHPPIYFYLLHGWLRLTGHDSAPSWHDAFAVRFLSLWFGVLLVPLLYALGRRVGGWWAGLGAAVGAACLPFLVGEAQEARMYTMVLVWLVAAGLALLRASGSSRGSGSRRHETGGRCHGGNGYWLLFALFSALALLTHYAAVFALVALWGWAGLWALAGWRGGLGRRLRAVLSAGLATALLCLPGLPVALRQIPSYRNPNLVVPSMGAYLAELAHVYGLGEHVDVAAARPWAWALTGLLAGGLLLALVTRPTRESEHHLGPGTDQIDHSPGAVHQFPSALRPARSAVCRLLFTFFWCVLPLVVYYLVIADRSTFAPRYIAVALPGWLLLGGLAVAGWARLYRVAGGVAALGLAVVMAPGLLGDLTNPGFSREDTQGLAAWLGQETDPEHDLILVDQRYPFGLYWPRWNYYADGLPPVEPADLAPAQYLFVDINAVAERLAALARGRGRVFLVRWFESDTDPRRAAVWVLEKYGTRLGERSFRGYNVVWYATPPEADFELAPGLTGPPVDFSDQMRLDAYAFGGRGSGITSTTAETRTPVTPADKPIWVVARWSRLAGAVEPGKALPRGLKATVVLEDAHGNVVGRDDRPIVNDRHLAPLEWREVDRPLGVYMVHPEPATPPGIYTLKLAVYDPVTLEQLSASGVVAQGAFAALGQVTLTRTAVPPSPESLAPHIDATPALTWRGLRLLGRGPLPAQVSPGAELAFHLFWQADQGDLPHVSAVFTLTSLEPGGAGGEEWTAPLVDGYATEAWPAGEVVRGSQQRRLDPAMPAGAYRLTLRLAATMGAGESAPVELGEVNVAGRPRVFELPAQMAHLSGARFGDLGTLLGYDLVAPATRADELAVTLYWRAEAASPIPYAVSVQLLDEGDTLRAQRDQQPGNGEFPTTGWVADEVLIDPYRVELPAGLPPGAYTVIVKLYQASSGVSLPVTGADGAPTGDFLRLATVWVP